MNCQTSYKLYLKEEIARLEIKLKQPDVNKVAILEQIRQLKERCGQRLDHNFINVKMYNVPSGRH